jgi:hypothetical protein
VRSSGFLSAAYLFASVPGVLYSLFVMLVPFQALFRSSYFLFGWRRHGGNLIAPRRVARFHSIPGAGSPGGPHHPPPNPAKQRGGVKELAHGAGPQTCTPSAKNSTEVTPSRSRRCPCQRGRRAAGRCRISRRGRHERVRWRNHRSGRRQFRATETSGEVQQPASVLFQAPRTEGTKVLLRL